MESTTKERKEKQGQEENYYHCEICETRYTKEGAKVKKMCCKRKLTPLQDLYRSDPSPSGP